MSIERKVFGTDSKGQEIASFTLTNDNGVSLTLIETGAVIQSLLVPDKNGVNADVVLGYDNLEQYEKYNECFLGVVVGRSANRIKDGHFTIGGKEYQLAKNDGPNNLHSCPDGYHTRRWAGEIVTDENGEGVRFSLESPDGDQGFPGNLKIAVTYHLTQDNRVMLIYSGVSDADTVVNPTNHSYFNLAGHDSGTILDQKVQIFADTFTPAGKGLIPTGEFRSVKGTVMDFTEPKEIGQDIDADYEQLVAGSGYDHNYVLKNGGKVELAAILEDEASGRIMKVYTQMPGMQFYTGNHLDGSKGKGGCRYTERCGVCFESQFVPDSVNNPAFDSPVVKAGEPFEYVTYYQFLVK